MYLVTGATGFLGKHLVDRLLDRAGLVRCLVRPGSMERFERLVEERWYGQYLRAVEGDISQPGAGVDVAELEDVEHVFHVAALYDLSADEEACRAANVDGTRHVLELCEALGARLHHVSTIGVAGDFDGAFTELHLDEGQSHGHPYTRTKFEAEVLVQGQLSVPFRVYRPGAIVGSSVDGAADKADGIYMLFPLIRKLRGALPAWVPMVGYEGAPFPLAPVDWVAEAIDCLAHAPGLDGRALHLVDPDPPTFGTISNVVAKAAHAPKFAFRVDPRAFDLMPGAAMVLRGLGPVRRARRKILGSGDSSAMLRLMNGKTSIDATATHDVLRDIGVPCPGFEEYAAKLWDYWERNLRVRDQATLASRVDGKVVMVTGASSGIGWALALDVAGAGATTVLVARSADKLADLKAEIEAAGGRAAVLPCDLSDLDAVDALVAKVTEEHGGVDVLINNAGRSIRRPISESAGRFHDFERTIALNYFGALRLTLGVLPGMRERGDGHVLNVLTMGLQTYVPRYAAYIASKSALEAASRSIAAEVLNDGVRFTSIYMPLVRTPMIAPSAIYKGWPALSPEEGAAMVVDGIVRRPARVTTSLGTFSSLWGIVAPELGLRILNRGSQLVPAKDEEPDPDAPPKEPSIVGKILNAVHW